VLFNKATIQQRVENKTFSHITAYTVQQPK